MGRTVRRAETSRVSLLRTANALLSRGGAEGRLAILIFHRVVRSPDAMLPAEPDAERFTMHMQDVRRWFRVLPLEQAAMRLSQGTLPARALCITFDDGYADNCEVALPILRDLGLHATFFIASGFLEGGCMWNDRVIEALRRTKADRLDLSPIDLGVVDVGTIEARRRAVDVLLAGLKYRPVRERSDDVARLCAIAGVVPPTDLMMTRAQVHALSEAGMTVGAHTRHHPILATLASGEASAEIAGGKADLEAIVDKPVRLFAYPNGKPGRDYGAEHVRAVEAQGFAAACSTAPGVATPAADRFQLPRFTPWRQGRFAFGAQLARNLRQVSHARV